MLDPQLRKNPIWAITRSIAGLLLLLPPEIFAADGAQLAAQFCAACHGEELTGARAPALRGGRWQRARSDAEAMEIVVKGLPEMGMPAFGGVLSANDRAALLAFIQTPAPPRAAAPPAGEVVRTELQDFVFEQVAFGFEVPWSIAFLPDGRLLVTERAGRLRLVEGGQVSPPIRGIPAVWYRQDAGLLSLALDPDYSNNGWIYLSYSEPGDEPRTSMTKIIRGRIVDGAWTDQQTVWEVDARYYLRANDHYGCRLLFHDGKLFFSIGERSHRAGAQDLSSPLGKFIASSPTAASRPTTLSWERLARTRRCGPTATATRRASPSTAGPGNSGRPNTAPWAGTNSTTSNRERITAGRR